MNYDELVDVITFIGKKMLECGAESNRVEDSVNRMLHKYNATEIASYAISSQITVSAKFDGKVYTILKRVEPVNINYHRLDELNALSRKICANNMSYDEISYDFNKILNEATYPLWKIILGSILATSAFAIYFGGDYIDFIVAAVLGPIIVLSNRYFKPKINGFVHTILISFVVGIIGILFYKLNIGHHLDKVLIGTVMLLIPGMGLVNGVRDVFLGDTISGTLRIIESLLTAVSIAVGYCFAIYLLARGTMQTPENTVKWYVLMISGIVGTIGFAIIFHLRTKEIIISTFGTLFVLIGYIIFRNYIERPFTLVLIAAIIGCIYAELAARYAKKPAICILTVAILPLYPGGALYYTLSYLVEGDRDLFKSNIFTTGEKTIAIACAIVICSVLFKYIHRLLNRIEHRAVK